MINFVRSDFQKPFNSLMTKYVEHCCILALQGGEVKLMDLNMILDKTIIYSPEFLTFQICKNITTSQFF